MAVPSRLGGARRTAGATALAAVTAMVLALGVIPGPFRAPPAAAGTVGWPDAVTDTFTVYLAPPEAGGSDRNGGLSRTDPVASLHKVQDVLRRYHPETDVAVRIAPGTYVQAPLDAWRFYVPGHTISFLPMNHSVGESPPPTSRRPVFRNARCPEQGNGVQGNGEQGNNGGDPKAPFCDGSWFTARPPADPSHPFHDGGKSGLRFYYLTVERYSAAGISIRGDADHDVENEKYDPPLRTRGARLDANVIVGMTFRQIGNRWSRGHYGWGAIVLTGSSGNRIARNTFERIENRKPYAGYIHGVYVTHFSNHNRITKNTFDTISGDPVKVRDRSNYNVIDRNVFVDAGKLSYYRAEFCGKACAIEHDKAQECPSVGNRFVRNTLRGGYRGQDPELFSYSSGSYPTTTASACGKLTGKRLSTARNVTDH